ncbi:MAG: hypothetical protein ABI821_07085 [Pseudomonadota bacterium]
MSGRPVAKISILLTLLISMPAFSAGRHLLLGTWSVDVSRLSQPSPPASVTMVLAEAGGGEYSLTIDIVGRDGSKRHAGGSFLPGGPMVSVSGSDEVDTVIFTMPSLRILVMAGAFQGHPSHTRIWALSDDGKHMTETIVGHIDGKTPHIRTNIWNRK